MLYELKQNQQVVYVIPISSILGKLPLIPVGDTGTIPFSMRDELHEVDEASCDTKPGEGDRCNILFIACDIALHAISNAISHAISHSEISHAISHCNIAYDIACDK